MLFDDAFTTNGGRHHFHKVFLVDRGFSPIFRFIAHYIDAGGVVVLVSDWSGAMKIHARPTGSRRTMMAVRRIVFGVKWIPMIVFGP